MQGTPWTPGPRWHSSPGAPFKGCRDAFYAALDEPENVSYAVDVNILLDPSDTASCFHPDALAFFQTKTAKPESLDLAWPSAMACLRIVYPEGP